MNQSEKDVLTAAIHNITKSLNSIQAIRDDLSEDDEEAYGRYFGYVEDHGSGAEKYGEALLNLIKQGDPNNIK